MKPAAIEQAKARLERARRALESLQTANTFAEAESAWTDFLVAANTVYSKLEQGAKGTNRSETWFGRKKHDRKKDPLLSYIHHARNADEHGIDPISKREPRQVSFSGITEESTYRIETGGETARLNLDGGDVQVTQGKAGQFRVEHLGGPGRVEIVAPHIQLATVFARDGKPFDPPTQHLDAGLPDQMPLTVAALAMVYLDGLVADAANLPK